MNRRDMLKGAGALLATATSAQGSIAPSQRPAMLVFTGGHPGDPEFGCGGTIARLTALGHEVVPLYMNDGAWMQTSSEVRVAEAKRACDILKARPHYANQIGSPFDIFPRTGIAL